MRSSKILAVPAFVVISIMATVAPTFGQVGSAGPVKSTVAPAVLDAIVRLGDLHRDGAIDRRDGDSALAYYLRARFLDARSIVGVIPPDKLFPTDTSEDRVDVDTARRVYLIAGDLENPDAFVRLGDLYLEGRLVPGDPEKAFGFYRRAEDAGSQSASIAVAMMMIRGQGTERDPAAGLQRLETAADAGNDLAMLRLGDLYRDAEPGVVEPDAARALALYRRADDAGNKAAALAVARMTIAGEGTKAAPMEGLEIARRLSEDGYADAHLMLAELYASGIDGHMPADAARAFQAYGAAADAGSMTGLIQAGAMLIRGQGVERDVARGLGLVEQAAEGGNDRAMLALGEFYETGEAGALQADPKRAFGYYSAAAKRGNAVANLRVGRMTIEGRGTAPDPAAGVALLEKAGAGRQSDAYLVLGEYFGESVGGGRGRDLARSLDYYRKAAELGSSTARLRSALMLIRGQGTDPRIEEGLRVLRAAAADGNAEAHLALGDIHASGDVGDVDAAAAIAAYEMAASLGARDAYVRLGDLFAAGTVIPADGERAVGYYMKAAGLDAVSVEESAGDP